MKYFSFLFGLQIIKWTITFPPITYPYISLLCDIKIRIFYFSLFYTIYPIPYNNRGILVSLFYNNTFKIVFLYFFYNLYFLSVLTSFSFCLYLISVISPSLLNEQKFLPKIVSLQYNFLSLLKRFLLWMYSPFNFFPFLYPTLI